MKAKVKRIKLVFFSLIIIILTYMVFTPKNNIIDSRIVNERTDRKHLEISFNPNHEPITILGDSQFISENGVVAGNGSSSNPFIIENLIIGGKNTSSCIYIFYTTVYFIIKNCTFYNSTETNSGGGIKLEQVKNGKIYNNTITNNNGNGISLIYSTGNSTIYNNTISNNNKFGIFNYFNSDDNELLTNKFFNNNLEGIGGYLSENITIQDNIFKDNRGGLYIENNCINWIIYNNYFLVNLQECAADHGTNSIWHNGSSGNYWYDYDGVDTNGDGIGETPYQVSGDAFSEDPFPLVFPDFDNDGLDDLIEEWYYGTNKSKWDTDEDRYSDKIEVDFGTDPLNSADFPNNAFSPQLIGGGVDETRGYEHTNFTFFINYYDYDNNTPNYVHIIIDGRIYSMKKANISDNNYIDGCLYNFSIKLEDESHQYYFRSSDGTYINTTSLISGPIVEKTLLIISPLNQTYTTSTIDLNLRNHNKDLIEVYYRIFSISDNIWITQSNGTLFENNFSVTLLNGFYYVEFFGDDINGYYYQNQVSFTIDKPVIPIAIPGSLPLPIIAFTIIGLIIIIIYNKLMAKSYKRYY